MPESIRRTGAVDVARIETEFAARLVSFIAGTLTIPAVYWLAQAYDSAKGRATRFQWGTSYLMGMMDLIPDESERIQTESIRVLRSSITRP